MKTHIRGRPGLLPDLEGVAASIPDFDNREVWHEFRVTREPLIEIEPQGLVFADAYARNVRFSVAHDAYKSVVRRTEVLYKQMPAYNGHLIIFDARHPERRVFVPKNVWETVARVGRALITNQIAEAAKIVSMTEG